MQKYHQWCMWVDSGNQLILDFQMASDGNLDGDGGWACKGRHML